MVDLTRASRQRQTLNELLDRHHRLVHSLLEPRELIKGTFYKLRTRCGKPSCRCAGSDEARHVVSVLSWSEEGKSHLRAIAPAESLRVQRLSQSYRDFRRIRAGLVRMHRQILVVIDRLERSLRVPPPPPRRPRRR